MNLLNQKTTTIDSCMRHLYAIIVISLIINALECSEKLEVKSTEPLKILLLPFGNQSHLFHMHGIGRELLERGHRVHLVLCHDESLHEDLASAGYVLKRHQGNSFGSFIPHQAEWFQSIRNGTSLFQKLWGLVGPFRAQREIAVESCRRELSDSKFLSDLASESYNIALIDCVNSCAYLVASYLHIEYVTLSFAMATFVPRAPFLPSVQVGDLSLFDSDYLFGAGFFSRLSRFLAHYMAHVFLKELFLPVQDMAPIVNMSGDLNRFWEQSSLFIFDFEPLFADEYFPEQGNVVIASGLTTEKVDIISDPEIRHIADNAKEGIIFFHMGTYLRRIPVDILLLIIESVQGMKQHLLMKLDADIIEEVKSHEAIRRNVLLSSRLVPNEILGHKNTILFITHCGHCGRSEALYHGVPILAIPVMVDQLGKSREVVERGFGLRVDVAHLAEEFPAALHEMLSNESYLKAIRRASAIVRSRTKPAVRAVAAIEHVIRFGSQHLRPHRAYELSYWQFYMGDIFLFL